MKFLSLDSPIMRFMDKLGSFMLINICFILFSIPVITIGASATAMYRCFLTMATDSEVRVLKLFWSSFKSNFKQATLLELCVLPAVVLVVVEFLAFLSGAMGNSIPTAIVFILPAFVVTGVVSYIFPLQAQFENKVFATIKNAALMSVSHLPATVLIAVLNLIFPVMFCFAQELFAKTFLLWVMFGFALIAYYNTSMLRKIFIKYFPEIDKKEETEIEDAVSSEDSEE